MPSIGPMELIVVLVLALVVLGPKRLPEAGKSLGKGLREFKSSIAGNDKDELDTSAFTQHAAAPVAPAQPAVAAAAPERPVA